MLGNLLCLLTGTMLGHADPQLGRGRWWRTSSTSSCCPTVSGILAASQDWFRDLQPWVDLNYAQAALFEGMLTGDQWAHVAATVGLWLVLPGIFGLRRVMRSEVK